MAITHSRRALVRCGFLAFVLAFACSVVPLRAFLQGPVVPPSNLKLSLLSFTGIELTWGSGSAPHCFVSRSANGGPFVRIADVTGGIYRDERLDVGTRYDYTVSGYDSTPNGDFYTGSVTGTLSTPAFLTNDIGAVGAKGSTVPNGNTISLAGAGADIWGTADAFHFAQESWGGDGTLVVRVNQVQPTATWAKVGVMFRESLTPGSRYVMAAVNPNGDGALLSRAMTDGESSFKISVYTYSPMWVKLTRTGSLFEAFQSRDGISWVELGSVSVDMPLNIYAGLAITSHVEGTLASATVDNYSVSARWNPGVPAAPVGLGASLISAARVELRWTDGSNAARYDVERASDGVHFALIGSVAPGVRFFADLTTTRGTHYTYRVRARNDNGASPPSNVTTIDTPALSPTGGPVLALRPGALSVDPGSLGTFAVTGASAAATFRWQRNGVTFSGPNQPTFGVNGVMPGVAGIYSALVTDGGLTLTVPGILGLRTTAKVFGDGSEYVADIQHPNGNVYDQVLMSGPAVTVTADPGQVTRTSFVDLANNIVQVEFSGAGTLTITLDNYSGPAAATLYNQPGVVYMRGHPSLVIVGANESTNVSVFSVGRMTATNQAIFRSGVTYGGVAGVGFLAIASTNGRFGGVWTANATYFQSRGPTGIYAPDVQFSGPVYVNDIAADSEAIPMLLVGGASDVRVTGGDMQQFNVRPIQVSGLTQVRFTAGTTSHGTLLPAQENKAVFEENGGDITARLVAPQ